MIIDGIIEALLAHLGDEFLDHCPISCSNRARIGDHSQVRGLQIFEENVAVEGQIELRLIQDVKDDDIVAFETKLAESFDDRPGRLYSFVCRKAPA